MRYSLAMGRRLFALAVAAGLLVPAPAGAADLFVGASRPGASDGGNCTTVGAPCATIQVAVDKAEGLGGGTVRVLPNLDGRTTDIYAETVVLDGSAPITLLGAGRRANGTRLAPSSGTPLTLGVGTTARSLRLDRAARRSGRPPGPSSTTFLPRQATERPTTGPVASRTAGSWGRPGRCSMALDSSAPRW
jgi:hypothetical protein